MSVIIDGTNGITFPDSSQQYNSYYGFKNRIINGAMVIDQRNAGASFTNSNAAVYGVDRMVTFGLSGAVLTCQQVTDAPNGFSNSFKATVSTATTANDTGVFPVQKIEASNCSDLMWGTSTAATITVSFWVKASVTGTYNTSLLFYGPTTLFYVSTFTVNNANTWEQKSITITGPTTGGAFSGASNAAYLALYTVTVGSTGNTSYATANTWSSSGSLKTSGAVNIGSTLNATLQVTGVQLEKGSTATSFDYRPYGTELQLCMRYFQFSGFAFTGAVESGSTTTIAGGQMYQVPMRAAPSGTANGVQASFRENGGDYQVASPTLSNFSTSAYGYWTQVGGFTGLTALAPVFSRNNSASYGNGNFISLSAEL